MRLNRMFAFFVLASMLLAACTPGSPGATIPSTTTPAPAAGTTPSPAPQSGQPIAVQFAVIGLAKKLGIPTEQIKVGAVEQVQWPDACLGAAAPDELCAQVVTNGYKVNLEANGNPYEVHTNSNGSAVRVVEATISKGGVEPGGASSAAVTAAVTLLAQQLGVPASQVTVVSAEAVEWPNGCLGVLMPGRMCTQVITPGYRVVLESGGKQYEFHTDGAGGAVLPAVAAMPQTADKVVVWEQTEGSACSRVEIGAKGAAFGPCGGALKETPLLPGRVDELNALFNLYSAFNGTTKSGSVQFNGQGSQTPSDAEKRSLAEWAKQVFMEAQSGRSGAAWGLALSWHREGGIAGFCDDLGVNLSGWAYGSSCKPGQTAARKPYHLTGEELAQLYQWVDQLKNFDYQQQDAATTDAMKISLAFQGAGTGQASADQQQQIAAFAAQVYTESAR